MLNNWKSFKFELITQVWQLGSSVSNFTLEGHDKGVNCVDYYHGGDKPYLISGADDQSDFRYIKVGSARVFLTASANATARPCDAYSYFCNKDTPTKSSMSRFLNAENIPKKNELSLSQTM